MYKRMKNYLLITFMGLMAMPAFAGAPEVWTPVVYHDINPQYVSLREAEHLYKQGGVYFFDVNTLEVWADGFIPGAVFFNVKNWKSLLPKNKDAPMLFYCANRLCTSSVVASREVIKLGYTNVMQLPDGIYGWRTMNYPVEKP